MFKGRRVLLIMFSLLFVLGTVLAGCGGGEEGTQDNGEKSQDSGEGKTDDSGTTTGETADVQELHLLIGDEPPGMDSGKTTDTISFMLLNNVMEGLMRLDDQNKPIPGIAESYEVSEDGLTYTFHLRDANWSDGSALTAKDFEYAWKRALDPATASEYAYIMYQIKGAQEFNTGTNTDPNSVGIKAIDDKTLEVVLSAPAPYFLGLTAFATFLPAKEEFVTGQGDKYATEANTLLYNGPFVMTEWSHDQKVVLEKNANYWDAGTVKLEKITFDVVKDQNTAVTLYEAGDVDRTGLAAEQVTIYKADPNFSTKTELVVFYLQYNAKKSPLDNVKIREAFSAAIDRQAYVDAVLNNGSQPALAFVPYGVPGLNGEYRSENGDLIKNADPEAAKALLAEGLKEEGLSALPEIHFLTTDSDTAKKGAEVLKEMWRQNLGVDVVLDMVPFKERLKRTDDGNFDIVFSGWGADYNDPMTFLDLYVSGGGFNDAGYSSAAFDEAIKFGQTSADVNARMGKMLEAEKILMKDLPIAPVYFRGSAYVTRPYVKNIVSHPFGADYDFKWAYIEGKDQ
jgi:oligopeptide transport system substrate-binding protein